MAEKEKNPLTGSKQAKSEIALKEEKILEFWEKNEIFKKTLEKAAPRGEFVFFEGPPTANAKPALHHLESRVFKDIIPRYKTMRGFHVNRRAGWDTHGLPVELQIEKKLGLKSKKEIEQYGVEQFNKECKQSVFDYVSDWEKFTDRIGYWVDKKDAYYTFDTSYIESVWNILKEIDKKSLLYKDYKVLPWCPRCGTALSSHELAQGYQDDKDLAVTVEFIIKDRQDTSVLAWTTTPWTLPGNVALAVNSDIVYVEIEKRDMGSGKPVKFILAKDRLDSVFANDEYKVVKEMKGSDLVGLKYEPLYNFLTEKFRDKNPEAFDKSYRIYPADFVNTTDGTGVVHTAVMYGQDDFVLGTEVGLPKFHLVKEDGKFLDGMDFLSDRFVKDEDVAVDIVKDLAHRGLLFSKEKYTHSYPHCWRCNTSLIYYARDSWYIKMSSLCDELVKENEGINWEPGYIKEGRFGEWLREIKDWAISRERYWGTPLPIWERENGEKIIIGSIEELKNHIGRRNNYILMRHGGSEGNEKGIISCKKDNNDPLTKNGRNEALISARGLSKEKIDVIISSSFLRTRETAEIVAEEIGLDKNKIVYNDDFGEVSCGKYEGTQWSEFDFSKKLDGAETMDNVRERVIREMYKIDKEYDGKNILIIGHGGPLNLIKLASDGLTQKEIEKKYYGSLFKNAEIRRCDFVALPHNDKFEIDLHRPYIDSIEFVDEKGSKAKRVKEVLDVWFDSGAMPFAQDHYPFNNEKLLYPADFISEAIDQTRGWFYTLHAIGILLGKGKAYKNVICLGHILDTEGKKMSKSIGNIMDPWVIMNKYGVDALRLWMYTVNNPGDSKNFDEKTVDEIVKKVFNPALNILAFYELYKNASVSPHNRSTNVLDKWILSRLSVLIKRGTESLEKFQVFESARLIRDFVNDFSTWYIRRSRDRFKSDDVKERDEALSTTSFVLLEFTKYMASFTPFFSEEIYLKLKSRNDPESVHLCEWPKAGGIDQELLDNMNKARDIVTKTLELRQKAGIKVRQPLALLTVGADLRRELLVIIADEVNVKKVVVSGTGEIKLDTNLTKELRDEGYIRDIIRSIQDARKMESLSSGDKIQIIINTDKKDIIDSYLETIKSPTQVTNISYSGERQKYAVQTDGDDNMTFSIVK